MRIEYTLDESIERPAYHIESKKGIEQLEGWKLRKTIFTDFKKSPFHILMFISKDGDSKRDLLITEDGKLHLTDEY